MRARVRGLLLAVLASLGGCNLDQRLLLTVSNVPSGAQTVAVQVVQGSDGADGREPLVFATTASQATAGTYTLGLYIPRGTGFTIGALARDAQGCALAAGLTSLVASAHDGDLRLDSLAQGGVPAPSSCTPGAPALVSLVSMGVDQYRVNGFGFRQSTRVLIADLAPGQATASGGGCQLSAGRCVAAGAALALRAVDSESRLDLTALQISGTGVHSTTGRADVCLALADASAADAGSSAALLSCTPLVAQLLVFVPTSYSLGGAVHPDSVTLADFDQDGHLDIALAAGLGSNSDQGGGVVVLRNQGGGSFSVNPLTLAAFSTATSVTAADLNGDGWTDLISSDGPNGQLRVIFGAKGAVPGPQSPTRTLSTGGQPDYSIAADLNGDGKVDLAAVTSPGSPMMMTVTVLANQLGPDGLSGSMTASSYATNSAPLYLAPIRLSGAPSPDLLITDATSVPNGSVTLLRNQAALGQVAGLFAAPEPYATYVYAGGLAVADLNGDGLPDVAATGGGLIRGADVAPNVQVSVLFGQATAPPGGALGPVQQYPAGSQPFWVAAADLDSDGHQDLVITNVSSGGQGALTLLRNQGSGTFPTAGAASYTAGVGSAVVAIGDLDGDGRPDLVVVNQGKISPDPTQALPGTLTVYLNRTPLQESLQ